MFLFYISMITSVSIGINLVQIFISLVLIARSRTVRSEGLWLLRYLMKFNSTKFIKLDFYQQCINNSTYLYLTNTKFYHYFYSFHFHKWSKGTLFWSLLTVKLRKHHLAESNLAQLIERWPADWKVPGSIRVRGIYLG